VDEDSVFDMESDSAGECEALAIAAEADEVVGLMVVLHAGNLLFDDGALVEVLGGVVAGRADQLHAALESAAVRIGSDKSGKKGMVDIDNLPSKLAAEGLGEDLHEAGENDEFGTLGAQEGS
jgi:hypothetical protein